MAGNKLRNALLGINSEIKELKKDNTANYLYTLVHFGSTYRTVYGVKYVLE